MAVCDHKYYLFALCGVWMPHNKHVWCPHVECQSKPYIRLTDGHDNIFNQLDNHALYTLKKIKEVK